MSSRRQSDSRDYFTYSSLDSDGRRDSWRQRGSFSFSSNNYESDKSVKSSYFTYSQPVSNSSTSIISKLVGLSNGNSGSSSSGSSNGYRDHSSVSVSVSSAKRRDSFCEASRTTRSLEDAGVCAGWSEVSPIVPGLYLSGLRGVTADRTRQIGVTLLVSVMRAEALMRAGALPLSIDTVTVPVDDCESADLARHFSTVLPIMQRHISPSSGGTNSNSSGAQEECSGAGSEGGAVLVHCVAGISRSATVVIAYLMRYHRMSLVAAYNLVKSRRSCIQPNASFWRQLVQYEATLLLQENNSGSTSSGTCNGPSISDMGAS